MNWAHIHLILNHIPVLGFIAGSFVLLIGLFARHATTIRAAWLFFVVSGVFAIPVYFTGEPAEAIIERLVRSGESFIEKHEQSGLYAVIAAGILGALSLGALVLWRKAREIPVASPVTILVAAVGVSGLMGWTANLGGKIRHTELRSASLVSDGEINSVSSGSSQASHDDEHEENDDED